MCNLRLASVRSCNWSSSSMYISSLIFFLYTIYMQSVESFQASWCFFASKGLQLGQHNAGVKFFIRMVITSPVENIQNPYIGNGILLCYGRREGLMNHGTHQTPTSKESTSSFLNAPLNPLLIVVILSPTHYSNSLNCMVIAYHLSISLRREIGRTGSYS